MSRPVAAGRTRGRLADKVVLVTGGSSGIGRAACHAAAREGAAVVVVGRDAARVAETVAEAAALADGGPDAVLGVPADVRAEADVERMVRRAEERFGRVDALVASAGIGRGSQAGLGARPVASLDAETWDEIIRTNLTGLFLSARAVLPAMLARQSGDIVAVGSSIAGTAGQPYAAAYCASKFGVRGLAASLREEVEPFGVRVHVVAPGVVDTPMTRGTTLLRGGALAPIAVAGLIVEMLALPEDVVLVEPAIGPS